MACIYLPAMVLLQKLFDHMDYRNWFRPDDSSGQSHRHETPSCRVGFSPTDQYLWSIDLGDFETGQFSMAVVKNKADPCEVKAQVETAPSGIFIGIYDGHNGTAASDFALQQIMNRFVAKVRADEHKIVTPEALQYALTQTEAEFKRHAIEESEHDPSILAAGSCCIVGVVALERLYIANVGDSRAVLGRCNRIGKILDIQLTSDHNTRASKAMTELKMENKDDPHLLEDVNGLFLVKGRTQLTRSIGDVYLKDPTYQDRAGEGFGLSHPINKAVIFSDPDLLSTSTTLDDDRFVIFASAGFWKHIRNEKAVELVHSNIRNGSAKRLIEHALLSASKEKNEDYNEWMEKGNREACHDEMTVVVVFLRGGKTNDVPKTSVRPFEAVQETSELDLFQREVTSTGSVDKKGKGTVKG